MPSWAAPDFQLIETLGWEQARGFVRLERHLARQRNSARELGFPWRDGAAEQALQDAVSDGVATRVPADRHGAPMRVRLTLAPDGTAAASAEPMEPTAPGTVWRLAIASVRLSSSDPLLRHKTSRRGLYDAARAEFPRDHAEEVILLNERGELCEGTITSLFLDRGDGGPLLTPPLSSGLLASVLRGELIETGGAVEQVLRLSDLQAAQSVLVGNSLRGLVAARVHRIRRPPQAV